MTPRRKTLSPQKRRQILHLAEHSASEGQVAFRLQLPWGSSLSLYCILNCTENTEDFQRMLVVTNKLDHLHCTSGPKTSMHASRVISSLPRSQRKDNDRERESFWQLFLYECSPTLNQNWTWFQKQQQKRYVMRSLPLILWHIYLGCICLYKVYYTPFLLLKKK